MEDMMTLKKELARVEGRVFDFGTYRGWTVEAVGRVDRNYLYWCLTTVRLRPDLEQSILQVLATARRHRTLARMRASG
jgi:hypothetical protein